MYLSYSITPELLTLWGKDTPAVTYNDQGGLNLDLV